MRDPGKVTMIVSKVIRASLLAAVAFAVPTTAGVREGVEIDAHVAARIGGTPVNRRGEVTLDLGGKLAEAAHRIAARAIDPPCELAQFGRCREHARMFGGTKAAPPRRFA